MDMSWLSKFSLSNFSLSGNNDKPIETYYYEEPDETEVVDYLKLGYQFHPDYSLVYNYCLEKIYQRQERISPQAHHDRRYFYSYHHENIQAEAEGEAQQIIFHQLRHKRLHEVFNDWGL